MSEKKLELSDELLQNLSIEQIAELKVKITELLSKVDDTLNN